jgi:4-hydroxy-tetrahydrodipicolinate synthase/4-hydroxy-2-oxoglutarate aldolase
MNGTGVPLVTPFDDAGTLLTDDLATVARWLANHVDFLVPCGSTGEAPLMGTEERTTVVETVAAATDLPVLAGTGHPGLAETLRETERAAEAGADAALVVTPFYYGHGRDELAAYYRHVADESPIPVYLYSVPKFTGVALEPPTVADLATHPNVAGIKDSSGDLARLQRTVRATRDEEFDVLVGSGSVYGPGLEAGADGGILALGNAVPERSSRIYQSHRDGDGETARRLTVELQALNRAITATYGVPGVKTAVRHRGKPAGRPRSPLRLLEGDDAGRVRSLVDEALN